MFRNRIDAGQKLATALKKYRGQDIVVYALPRGGVVVGAEVAESLSAPMDTVFIRKIGHPRDPEYTLCVVTDKGDTLTRSEDQQVVDEEWFQDELHTVMGELEQMKEEYLEDDYEPISAEDKVAIIVDDGAVSGLSVLAAVRFVAGGRPRRIVVALPAASEEAIERIANEVNDIVLVVEPEDFKGTIEQHYEYFEEVEDDRVVKTLEGVRNETANK